MEQENELQAGEEIRQPEVSENDVNITTSLPTEEKEVPAIDLSQPNTEKIISQAEQLIHRYSAAQIKDIIEPLPALFESLYKKEYEKALSAFTADGGKPEDFQYPATTKERFYSLIKQYKEKKAEANKKQEAEREKNLQIKLQLIEELKELVQKEEALNQTFQEFKDIQERWRNTGPVPQARTNDLLETFHLHVENFYNYIKINKELRDLDLKRNLDAKLALCEEAEKLNETNNITEAFKQLQLLHAQWKEIGPIPKEQKDPTWERFKKATDSINDSYHNFFEELRKEQENNLKVKEEICEKATAISTADYKGIGEWNNAAKNLIDLQEEWKHTGTVPLKERNKIYKKFRTSCDQFFDRKRQFYKTLQEEQENNLKKKTELCEKVEAVMNSTDWKVTTDKIISWQKEWKKIGPAPQKYSNKVWNRFRAACDTFFNNKNAFFKTIDSEQENNLEQKRALLEEINRFIPGENNEDNLKQLKEFQVRWSAIGFVPLKEKDGIQEEFRKAINAHFDKMNLDEFDKNLEKFRAKLQTLDKDGNKDYKIINEREKLVAKIRQLENDINTWENNIGFIAKSRKSEGLIRELHSKIEKTKQRLSLLQEKLRALDSLI